MEDTVEEKERAAFLSIMAEPMPSSPDTKIQDDTSDRIFVMENLISQVLAEEHVCTGKFQFQPSPSKDDSVIVLENDERSEQPLVAQAEKSEQPRMAQAEKSEQPLMAQAEKSEQPLMAQAEKSEQPLMAQAEKREQPLVAQAEKSEQPPAVRDDPPLFTPIKRAIIKPTMLPSSDIRVPSLQPPQHKIYHKMQPFSNKARIINALQYAVFPGQVNIEKLNKAKSEINGSAAKHFLILFRDHRCQFRGLYSWDQKSSEVHKISGIGPATCTREMLKTLFKYNSGCKRFDQVPAKDFGNLVDGFAIDDSFWMKPKPNQGAAAANSNSNN